MALFDKEKIAGALANAKNSIEKTVKETSETIKQKNDESKELKAPINGAIIRYAVVYGGGLVKYQKVKSGEIGLNVMSNKFIFKATSTSKEWFEDMEIPYENMIKIEVVRRKVSNAEWLLSSSSSDMKAMEQENNIEFTYNDEDGKEQLLRVEMLTGVSIYGQAGKCREMMDVLRQNGLLDLINKNKSKVEETPTKNDVLDQLEKLAKLKESGILTDEEFNSKKSKLLELI